MPDSELVEVLVLGRFRSRTRTTIANKEAPTALTMFGIAAVVSYILGAPSTSTVVKVKMRNWSAVTRALAQFRDLHLVSDYAEGDGRRWALRGKSAGEIARTAPASRAHRRINDILEGWKAQGWEPRWQLEAFYKPNEEGLDMSYNNWQTEQSLIRIPYPWRRLDNERRTLHGVGADGFGIYFSRRVSMSYKLGAMRTEDTQRPSVVAQ